MHMENIKSRIQEACEARSISVSSMLMTANIQSGDYYQAVNGKRPLFKGWRVRIANALNMDESVLFPEFQDTLHKSSGKMSIGKLEKDL